MLHLKYILAAASFEHHGIEWARCVFVGEMFMAALLPSSQRCEEVASLQSQVSQEKELRAVMEGCFMEEKMAWRRVNAELVENHRLAQDMSATLAEFRACRSELLCRLSAEEKSITGVQGGHTGDKGEVWHLQVTFYCYQTQRPLLDSTPSFCSQTGAIMLQYCRATNEIGLQWGRTR